eukprot:TRINITY_DN460_c0_g1_i2.p2 TRINITY_DN460_c0_g1~~TRINITY_DN460_c0_g1_i2.p2  ORF type:complete len:120 (-),score=2.49 TRINITY_DN460_c0_g1_i2:33-392(-)
MFVCLRACVYVCVRRHPPLSALVLVDTGFVGPRCIDARTVDSRSVGTFLVDSRCAGLHSIDSRTSGAHAPSTPAPSAPRRCSANSATDAFARGRGCRGSTRAAIAPKPRPKRATTGSCF